MQKKKHIRDQSTQDTTRISQWFDGDTEAPWEGRSGNSKQLQSCHCESDCPVN